ncbi:MAG: hypothetical protein R3C49_24515 [Planctomycetaceae bacterium]
MMTDEEALAALKAHPDSFVVWRDDTKTVARIFPLGPDSNRFEMLAKLSDDYGGPVSGRFVEPGEFTVDIIDRWREKDRESEAQATAEAAANAAIKPVPLENQLKRLAACGITLDDGVTVDDMLYSFDRDAYESEPFGLLLFILGAEVEREPWGRPFCSRVWNFDTECIYQTGDYVRIVTRLWKVAGQPELITNVADFVDLQSGKAWLKYSIDGNDRDWTVEVNDDWAETLTLSYVMDDIERDGFRFYSKNNGQAMILYYLDAGTAAEINELSNNSLQPVIPG